MARGRFITLEGGDGAGKSTQAAMLCQALGTRGIETVATREPGGSPGAEEIRALLVSGALDRWDPITEAMLHFAARRDHMRRTIEPALARGAWVISDRFSDSTMAYQGYGQGGDRDAIARLRDIALDGFAPDLTIMLDLPVDVGLTRAAERRGETSRYERMDVALHERIRAGFAAIAGAEPDRCALIDATGSAAAVHGAIRAVVTDRLGVALGA